MADKKFTITLNSRLVPIAQQMHQVSRIGDDRRGPNQSFEAYLSDVMTTAIVERRPSRSERPNRDQQLRA